MDDGFKPIGPPPLGDGKKTKYKFVEPPGVYEWVVSFAKKSLVCALVYSMGYFQVSVGWLVGPIVLLVVRDQWHRHHEAQRRLAAAGARGDEREIVLARLGDNLPSWVIFPDVERAEWLNMILKQLWPRINHYTYNLVVQSIEPGLKETLATTYKMGSFRFEKIILGDTPLRVRGVKVYDEKKTDRNEIIMDLDVIYAGDCDFRFSVAKIKAGIKDLQLSGTLRLVMKPLVNKMPLIGGVQYFFLNPPSLDFNLIGVADVFDMPGLSDLIRRIVSEQICSMVVLPNKMSIQLSDEVNLREVCATQPQGVVRVCAVEARNLLKKDLGVLGMGKSDPYIVLSVGAQNFRSKTINNTVNPKWEYYCEMLVEELGQTLNVVLWDHDDAPRTDEFLGRASVELSTLSREGTMDTWIELQDVKKGEVHLKLTWLGFTHNPVELKSSLNDALSNGLASALLTVKLDSAKNLPVRENSGSKPDPYAILSVGKSTLESVTLEKTIDPVFEQTFHFLVKNPYTDSLVLKMMDRKSNQELGLLKQSLDLVFSRPGLKMEKQNFAISTRGEAKVVLSMELKVLKPTVLGEIESETEDEKGEGVGNSEIANGSEGGSKSSRMSSAEPGEVTKPQTSGDTTSIRSQGLDSRPSSIRRPESKNQDTADNQSLLVNDDNDSLQDSSMRIQLTIRHSPSRSGQLIVVVHAVTNLPIEKGELPDPYVKAYVLPERSKKQKTEALKDQTHPVFDEKFEFPLVDVQGHTLEVTVCDKKFIKSSPKLGDVLIPLDQFAPGQTVSAWYTLRP